MKDESSEEESKSEGLTTIVKSLAKLKKNKEKAKVSASEGLSNQLKAKYVKGFEKLLNIINSVE